jgi:hypothetical protein
MLPVSFPQANFVYKKPEGWTDEQCGDLSVWKGNVALDDHGNSAHTIISCWQPSKEDIEAINQGKPIFLYVTALGQPPVSLSTENPFIQQEQTN